LTLRAGVPARLTFVRTTDKTCATEVVFPSLNLKRALPLNQAVVVEVTPSKGELTFTCGMNMLRGTIVVN
jgi:plastocyanin domain-containing protein